MSTEDRFDIFYVARELCRVQPTSFPDDNRQGTLKAGELGFSDPAKFNAPFDLKPHITNLVPNRCHD